MSSEEDSYFEDSATSDGSEWNSEEDSDPYRERSISVSSIRVDWDPSEAIQVDLSVQVDPEIHKFWTEAFDTQAAGIRSARQKPEKIQFWDKQIASLSSLLVLARSNRELVASPILRLPSEILLRISHLVVENDQTDVLYRGALKRSWLGLSYVCRTWRRILLSSPLFWDNLPIIMLPLWEIFQQRSNSIPLLSLHGSLKARLTERVEHVLTRSQRRIKSIHFHFTDDESFISLFRSIRSDTSSFPSLRNLKLFYSNDRYFPREIKRRSLPLLRSHLRHIFNAALHLRDIELEAYIFPWDVAFPNLRSLKVSTLSNLYSGTGISVNSRWISVFDTEPFTISQIAKCLSTMPLLEELDLSDFHTSSVAPATQSSVAVHLPSIRSLRLSATASHSFGLWQLLRVNPSASVDIGGNDVYITLPSVQLEASLSNIVSYINSPNHLSGSAISLSIGMPDRHEDIARRISYISLSTKLPRTWSLKLDEPEDSASFSWEGTDKVSSNLLQTLLAQLSRSTSIPFSRLEHLSFNRLESLSKDTWAEVLSAAPHLKILSVDCARIHQPTIHPIACLLSALTPPSSIRVGSPRQSGAQRSAAEPPLVPQLQKLEITWVQFSYPAHLSSESIAEGPGTDSQENLLQDALTFTLKMRSECGYPLSTLSIDSCELSPSSLEDWKTVVTKVWVSSEDMYGYGRY